MKKKIFAISGIILIIIVAVFIFIRRNQVEDTLPTMYADVSGLEDSTEDAQNYWSTRGHNFTKGENGYYFLNEMSDSLLFFDAQTKTYYPVCAKPDCLHNDTGCNAYLGRGQYLLGSVYYYRGNIYLFKIQNGNAALTQISADGSSRKILCEVMPTDGASSLYMVFHDDMVYVYDCWGGKASGVERTESIYQVSLKEGSIHTVYEYTGVNAAIDNARSFGNKLFFMVNEGVKNETTQVTEVTCRGLYAYDYATGETALVSDGNIYDYTINITTQELYYYITGMGLYREKIGEQNRELLYRAEQDTGTCRLSYDGKYLYMDNRDWAWDSNTSESIKCMVLQTDGTMVNTIPCPGYLLISYGDDKFMFAQRPGEGAMNGLVYIDKSEIESVKEWTRLSQTNIGIIQ